MFLYFAAFVTWIILVILAVINGFFRDLFYKPKMGELRAHQVSTLIFVILLIIVSNIFVNNLGFEFNSISLVLIGFEWLIFTLLFEFLAGHYVFGTSWKKLFYDYNLRKGRVWIFVLIFTFISPLLVWKTTIFL